MIKVFFAQFPRNGSDIGEILLNVAFLSPLRQLVWKLSPKFNDFIVKEKNPLYFADLLPYSRAEKAKNLQQKLILYIIVLHKKIDDIQSTAV